MAAQEEGWMLRVWLTMALTITAMATAIAEEKPEQELSAYKGLSASDLRAAYCIYNDKIFTKGAEICVRKGAALKCEGGAWTVVTNVCATAPDAHPAF
jgi:hypothetical protein